VARLSRRPREREVRLRAGELVLDLLWRLAGRWARPAMGGLALPEALDVAALACLADLPEADIRRALATLEEHGAVVQRDARTWVLLPPGPDRPQGERLRAQAAEQRALARLVQADTAALLEQWHAGTR
jgi:DNA-binding GntR family transcriptional regulator